LRTFGHKFANGLVELVNIGLTLVHFLFTHLFDDLDAVCVELGRPPAPELVVDLEDPAVHEDVCGHEPGEGGEKFDLVLDIKG